MKIPLHVKLRKKFRVVLSKVLALFSSNSNAEEFIDKNEIKNIMIIRPNYRIGNLIFLTPLINELQKNIPHAKIDIVVGMKLAGQILEPLPNVDKVIDIPRELLLHPLDMFRYIKDTREKKYDLAINISEGSTSSQIVTTLINAKYKASFENEKNWASFTHIVKKDSVYKHAGLQALEFLKLFNITLPKDDLKLDIKLTPKEIEIAQNDLDTILSDTTNSKNLKTIALFRNARFDKKIPDEWWEEWYSELIKLDENIKIIDILSPDILTKLHKDFLEYSNKNLRVLGAFFQNCDMYVSADTGPLHLSGSSDAKTLAFFNKTAIDRFGTLGNNNKTIDINNLTAKEVAKLTYEQLS